MKPVTKKARPIHVTVLACLLAAAGIVGFVYHVREFQQLHPFPSELVWVCLLRVVAILAGFAILQGRNWGRWVAVIWLAYHVVLSALHSREQLAAHAVLLVLIAYGLFRADASNFFNGRVEADDKEPSGDRLQG
jgi:hypothetical protein